MAAKAPYRVDAQALSSILGVPRNRIPVLVQAGLPCERQGTKARPWVFDLRRCVPWWGEFRERAGGTAAEGLDPRQERARLDRVTADARAFELEKARGEHVPATDQDKCLIGLTTIISTRLQGLGVKLAPRVAPVSNVAKVRDLIDAAVHDALAELADAGAAALSRSEAGDDPGARAELAPGA